MFELLIYQEICLLALLTFKFKVLVFKVLFPVNIEEGWSTYLIKTHIEAVFFNPGSITSNLSIKMKNISIQVSA